MHKTPRKTAKRLKSLLRPCRNPKHTGHIMAQTRRLVINNYQTGQRVTYISNCK